VAQASAALEEAGFEVQVDRVNSDSVDEGLVIHSDPPGGSSLTRGSTVVLTVSSGPKLGKVPVLVGYAVATADIVQKMRPYSMGSINALVKHGGAASLKDTAAQAEVKNKVMALRKKTTSELNALGYETLPSETNFFMVSIGREIVPVIEEFRKKGVAVGRPFPPMTTHMRVSIGTADEMARFMTAFKEIFPAKSKTTAGV